MQRSHQKFDEKEYLAANHDVALAVEAGTFASGLEHYTRFGYKESRLLNARVRRPPLQLPFPANAKPDRRDKILSGLDLSALDGLEIGALASPLVRSDEGNVFYVDYASREALRERLRNDPMIDTDNLVNVDGVWGEQTLEECIGVDKKVDYVVASHVVEHVPDLITWLSEICSVLKKNGTLRLAVPDRRYTFDYLRPESRIYDVLDAYIRRARSPLPRTIMEYHCLTREVDGAAAWRGELDVENLRAYHSIRSGLELALEAYREGAYHDVHCWVFTPQSFVQLCFEMAELGLLGLSCAHFSKTERNEIEFFVHMTPSESQNEIVASWAKCRSLLREQIGPNVRRRSLFDLLKIGRATPRASVRKR
jgi:SAM-dependent methyltransferase